MKLFEINFQTASPSILSAFLWDFPFEGFEERDGSLVGYIYQGNFDAHLEKKIRQQYGHLFAKLSVTEIKEKNWNAEWESDYKPVSVGKFCQVRASFHPPAADVDYDIVIDPKMAFGTGHHETTYLMIEAMRDLELNGKAVLDMGCGTGVLAILAKKMGAENVVAVDNDPVAVQNANENAALNETELNILPGSVEMLENKTFDFILANINRNVILKILPDLTAMLNGNGKIILSGILVLDREVVDNALEQHDLLIEKSSKRGEWICFVNLASDANIKR